MIAMTFTIELDIGLSVLLQAALPQLVTDLETKLIVVGGPNDRTATADAAMRSRERPTGHLRRVIGGSTEAAGLRRPQQAHLIEL